MTLSTTLTTRVRRRPTFRWQTSSMRRFASTLLCAAAAIIGGVHAQSDNAQWYSACQDGSAPPRTLDSLTDHSVRLPGQHPHSTHLSSSVAIELGYNPSCVAYGYYNDDISTTGWGYLHIETNGNYTSADQSYFLGYLEGTLTQQRMYQSMLSGYPVAFYWTNQTVPTDLYTWVATQNQWIEEQIEANPTSVYWTQVGNTYTTLQGMSDGYSAIAPMNETLKLTDILFLNTLNEISDILNAMSPSYRASQDVLAIKHDLKKVREILARREHCSALIRLPEDKSDLFSAHTTWTEYAYMLRIYKFYKFNIPDIATTHFSSYPGAISSTDDWYTLSSGLITIETTNDVINMTLYDYVKPQAVPMFVRVIVANQLATTGEEWSEMFAENNSGTYNNQWMIVDNKQFTPGQDPAPGTLWIASQIPGRVVSADVTDVLIKQGYWPSYNIAYFHELWIVLGYPALVKLYPQWGSYLYDYDNSFRALIFKRDAPKVQTLEDMKHIMQENNWQTDPLARGHADLQICARQDLSVGPTLGEAPGGSIDAKISSYSMMMLSGQPMSVYAKSGPTVESQPPFTWSTSQWATTPHDGQPDTFDFPWQTYVVGDLPQPAALKSEVAIE